MKVLITGGAGFIGSHVADHMLAEGHEVVIVDDLSTGRRSNVPETATLYECDIRDEQLADIIAETRPDVVCHLAAQMSVRVSLTAPRYDASVNVEGSVHVLECAVANDVRKIIYASTGGAIYGEPRYLPCDEDHPIVPLSHYGISKHTVEHYLELYAGLYGLNYTALRFPNVYGPRQDPDGEAGVVAIFAGRMLDGLPVTIYGDGAQQRDFVYVGDVARAHIAALDHGSGQAINLGSGSGTSVLDIYQTLADLLAYELPAAFAPARPGEVY
ncbi:MAG TPA: NAD-dependent epimerase/dehydratase family protein, partial [Thermomicrobiales bacterium]|nr:NAD-dependent epimerase/dehydratase family protein [Thermomicrobiales bacterium]